MNAGAKTGMSWSLRAVVMMTCCSDAVLYNLPQA